MWNKPLSAWREDIVVKMFFFFPKSKYRVKTNMFCVVLWTINYMTIIFVDELYLVACSLQTSYLVTIFGCVIFINLCRNKSLKIVYRLRSQRFARCILPFSQLELAFSKNRPWFIVLSFVFVFFLVQVTSRLHNGSLYVIVNMVNKLNKSENAGSECNHVFPLAWLQTLIARKLET